MKSTWRFVLKIVGLSLALAGLVCMIAGFWDALDSAGGVLRARHHRYPEFDDYDDDFYE